MANLDHWMIHKIRDHGDKCALVYDGHEYSYEELSRQIDVYSKLLAPSVPAGSVVAILSDYNFYAIALFVALMKHDQIIVPITSEVEDEITERLDEAYVDYVISIGSDGALNTDTREAASTKHDLINAIVADGHAGLVLFSSGSTGKPKAMIHDLDRLCSVYEDKKPKKISMMVFLMFDHIGGLNTMLNALSMGTTMVIPKTREAEHVCGLIEKHKVRILPASPTFLNLILMSGAHEKHDMSSLRMITYGTESMPEGLLHRLKAAFPKTRLLQTFGTSETGIAQTVSKSSVSTYMKIDDPNLEHKVVDGELWLRSKTQISGYLNASMERFSEDGWFKTGDLVDVDEDGFMKIIGRSQEMINVGGEKVLPGEVESVLLQIDDILDCTVYGEKNAITGQHVAANIVVKGEMTEREAKRMVRKFCKDKLEGYKIPMKVSLVGETEFSARFKKSRIMP